MNYKRTRFLIVWRGLLVGAQSAKKLETIDFDALGCSGCGDYASVQREWESLSPEARGFVRRRYPKEYSTIMSTVRGPTSS